MDGQVESTQRPRSHRAGTFFAAAWRGCAVLVLCAALLAPLAQAAGRAELRISLTILPSVDVALLPMAVQRLDARVPGYGDQWAAARRAAGHDPLQAVRALRRAHASLRERPDWQAWETDMVDAGQALFRPGDEVPHADAVEATPSRDA